jgi:hypothetical protein
LRAGLEGRPRDTFLHQIVQVKRAELFEPALYEVRTKYWIGAPSEQPKGPLPREVLRSISWSFAECGAIKDEAGFVRRVHGYHDSLLEIMRENDPSATLTGLRPDEIVVPAPIICVSYLARHDDVLLVLHASRPEGFTEAQLLHAIHNDAAPRIGQAHHHFFEGLHDPVESPLLPPCYQMSIGS